MECLALFVILLIVFVVLPFARMLFGKGPNNWRRLVRLDLAAFLVFTTGVAGALAVVRGQEWFSALCLLSFALPAAIALAWLGRFFLEDLAANRNKSFHEPREGVDLSCLSRDAVAAKHDEALQCPNLPEPSGPEPLPPDIDERAGDTAN